MTTLDQRTATVAIGILVFIVPALILWFWPRRK